ncbi:MAG TPA: saccharopine dehydrogenase family protein [Patescibacteria group bacterium]|nr:saccharopine dehydrogenase family protein [Patescibacteria group bacterium]
MKVIAVGSGNIGSVAVEDLATRMKSTEIVIADKDDSRSKAVVERIGRNNVSSMQLDIADCNKLVQTLKKFDLAMGFLPGALGYTLMKACTKAKKSLIDVSYMVENPLKLQSAASKARITIVPDCGLAPGISNFLVGHAYAKLEKTSSVKIMVGGLPEKPVPPLGYVITWSPDGLIDEYTRKAVIVQHGKKTEVEALGGVEAINFPEVGKLEAFYTDGLRTLSQTLKDVEEMWEKTLRYPGHAEKIKMIERLGFFEEEKVKIGGTMVSPRRLTARLLERKLKIPEIKDFVAMKIEVSGVKNGKRLSFVYHMLDKYDQKHGITAMARTTAYPMSIVAQLMLKGIIKQKGVIPPEKLGMEKEVVQEFLSELKKRDIKIIETKETR